MHIYDQYPLRSHLASIHKLVDEVVEEQVAKKHVIGPSSKTALAKKDLKGMGVQPRLQCLSSKGVLAVAERLSNLLRTIKMKEKDAAKENTFKAAAQHRILLPDGNEMVIRSLAEWMYNRGNLVYEDAEHLYALSKD